MCASSLISIQLLSRANRGASGKAATKTVTNPYWMTEEEREGGNHWARGVNAVVPPIKNTITP